MSDKIEIKVTINDKPATLADVSEKTVLRLRGEAKTTVKPIEHGDYGHREDSGRRLFIEGNGGKIVGYFKSGTEAVGDANEYRHLYTITGNIFKDMEKNNGS